MTAILHGCIALCDFKICMVLKSCNFKLCMCLSMTLSLISDQHMTGHTGLLSQCRALSQHHTSTSLKTKIFQFKSEQISISTAASDKKFLGQTDSTCLRSSAISIMTHKYTNTDRLLCGSAPRHNKPSYQFHLASVFERSRTRRTQHPACMYNGMMCIILQCYNTWSTLSLSGSNDTLTDASSGCELTDWSGSGRHKSSFKDSYSDRDNNSLEENACTLTMLACVCRGIVSVEYW